MTWTYVVTNLVGFLGTYFVHSTLILTPVWWLVVKWRWPADSMLRGQILKMSVVAPLATALTMTLCSDFHIGLQIPVVGSGQQGNANDDVTGYNHHLSIRSADAMVPPLSGPLINEGTGVDQYRGRLWAADDPSSPGATGHPAAGNSVAMNKPMVAFTAIICLWLSVVVMGLLRLTVQWRSLRRLRQNANVIVDAGLVEEKERLRALYGIRRQVTLLSSSRTSMPLAAGIFHPFILVPQRFPEAGSKAMLAHELGHIASQDASWNLILQVICRLFFFQPLNWLTSRAIRQEMDFKADSMAVSVLGDRMSLVECLYSTGIQLHRVSRSPVLVLASGMALFESTLGQRVEAILNAEPSLAKPRSLGRLGLVLVMLSCAFSVAVLAPRAVGETFPSSSAVLLDRNSMMNRTLASLLALAGMSMPIMADEPKSPANSKQASTATLKTKPDPLPEGMSRFNGMLVGRLAAKDVEQGTFVLQVDAVPRVWENSKAENPQSIAGKTVKVSGVFGKFLDVLVVTRIGDTLEFECKHDGEVLVFPGEMLRKVAAFDPADYPVLPEEFRGFRGQVSAEIVKKDPETFELIIRVDRVLKAWEESSAKDPKSIEGKTLTLAGFWNRRDAYHAFKVGEKIEVGMRHVGMRSEHLNIADAPEKTAKQQGREQSEEPRMAQSEAKPQKDSVQGFKGMLVGRLIEKDVERGTFKITVDAVPRVWENNQSTNPKSLIGKEVTAEGVTGRFIDALVVTKVGDTLEFGALHNDGPRVRVGEVLSKVGPVQPGDYPVLPDSFRGFRGMVTAKVIRKRDEMSELIVEVEKVDDTLDGNRAEKPQSIIGKQAILAGFWNRKDEFNSLRVGDQIRCGMNHTQLLSDHLVVIESVRKLDKKVDK